MVVEVDEAASISGQNSLIGVDDQGFVWAIDNGPKLIENDSDDDEDNDDDPTPTHIVTADPQEMENQAADVLSEDQINDIVVTDIAPQYCLDFTWNQDQGIFPGQHEPFPGTPGPTFPVTEPIQIIDIFIPTPTPTFLTY